MGVIPIVPSALFHTMGWNTFSPNMETRKLHYLVSRYTFTTGSEHDISQQSIHCTAGRPTSPSYGARPQHQQLANQLLSTAFQAFCNFATSMPCKSPAYLHNLISYHQPSRSLRSFSQSLLHVPRAKTDFGRRAFSSAAPQIWNHLPTAIKVSPSLDSFKRHLKTHYFTSP